LEKRKKLERKKDKLGPNNRAVWKGEKKKKKGATHAME
jgi:hypothetical protein